MTTALPSRRTLGATLLVVGAAFAAACGGGADEQPAGSDTAAPTPAVTPAGTAAPADSAATAAAATAGAATGGATPTAAAMPADGALLDPEQATREQLVALPGMTPGAADALIAGRPYADMRAVDRTLAAQLPDSAARRALYARLWKPLDLNKATDAEMKLIPGVGKRMAHEFEEYRPYRDMARFRREMGKYVDSAEVERLAKYVVIR